MANTFGKAKPGRGKSENTNKHRLSVQSIIDLVISKADIILEVLDARFIEKTRNPYLEKKAKSLGKELIYVLNKADLVDHEKIEKEQELQGLQPWVFFSSRQQKQMKETGKKAGKVQGNNMLMEMIGNQARKIGSETVNIGVIGYPNTGKSSLINFLTGKKAARTSSEAGHTRGVQKVKIGNGIYLLDTPGIIPMEEKAYGNRELLAKHVEIGSITWDRARDPIMIVHRIMMDYPNILEKHYRIEAEGDAEILIESLGNKMHFLKKHGLVDDARTAKQILKDWQEGKIRI